MSRPTKVMEITKTEFDKYNKVKKSDATNMFDSAKVSELSGLEVYKIRWILVHYKELERKYGK